MARAGSRAAALRIESTMARAGLANFLIEARLLSGGPQSGKAYSGSTALAKAGGAH